MVGSWLKAHGSWLKAKGAGPVWGPGAHPQVRARALGRAGRLDVGGPPAITDDDLLIEG